MNRSAGRHWHRLEIGAWPLGAATSLSRRSRFRCSFLDRLTLIHRPCPQQSWPQQRKWQTKRSTISAPRASGRNSVRISCHPSTTTLRPHIQLSAGDAVVVNPEISSGLPIQGINRYPPPGSRPERYSTPATKGTLLPLMFSQIHCPDSLK